MVQLFQGVKPWNTWYVYTCAEYDQNMKNYTATRLRAKIFAIEHELRQAKALAEQANVIKTEFMRNMEHDIRTPFNGVLAMASCLRDLETDVTKTAQLLLFACKQE